MPDKTLVCIDCNAEFNFTEGEQAFYQERGFQDPARCPGCRSVRKQQKQNRGGGGGGGRGGFNRTGGSGGGYNSNRPPRNW